MIEAFERWTAQAEKIEERWPTWVALQKLLMHAGQIKAALEAREQADVIKNQRLLLAEPEPVVPLVKSLEDALRQEIDNYYRRYLDELKRQMTALENDNTWQRLSGEQQNSILSKCFLEKASEVKALEVGTRESLLNVLSERPLQDWNNQIDALSGRFDRALELAVKELEPDVQPVELPRRIIKTDAELDNWIKTVQEELKAALAKGPVVIR